MFGKNFSSSQQSPLFYKPDIGKAISHDQHIKEYVVEVMRKVGGVNPLKHPN